MLGRPFSRSADSASRLNKKGHIEVAQRPLGIQTKRVVAPAGHLVDPQLFCAFVAEAAGAGLLGGDEGPKLLVQLP